MIPSILWGFPFLVNFKKWLVDLSKDKVQKNRDILYGVSWVAGHRMIGKFATQMDSLPIINLLTREERPSL